jgi:ribosome biogenesis SPOUT family RNA methylase Rps3
MLAHVGAGNLVVTNLSPGAVANPPPSLQGAILTNKPFIAFAAGVPLDRIALLDQCADECMAPGDSDRFDYVLCGGILGCDEFEGPMVYVVLKDKLIFIKRSNGTSTSTRIRV